MSSASPAPHRSIGTPESGMVIMVFAMLLVPLNDTLSKSLTDRLNPLEIALWRFLFQVLILAAVVAVRRDSLRGASPLWLLIGGVTLAATLGALISAFVVMPIATAIAIFFVEPLILTVLSALILGERTGWRRYIAVMVGLAGAIIVIRPGWDLFGWRALLPLAAALGFAINAVAMRKLSAQMSSVGIQFWFALIAFACLAVIVPFTSGVELLSRPFTWDDPWLQFAFMGVLSAGTFFLVTEAFRRTPASTLAPFQYLEIIGATILGYVVFGDFPDFWTWVGAAIILASGLYVFHRERRASIEPPRA